MSISQWLKPIIGKICKKIRNGGRICWKFGNYVKDGEVFPLDSFFYEAFISNGLKLRNRIIWKFNFGLHATKRFSGRYETLLLFTKGDDYKFNLNPVRVPQLYPGKRHSSSKGDNKAGKPSGNLLGKNPADFWTFSADESFKIDPIWDIPNVKANHPEYTIHPCQFPHDLAERCVLAFSAFDDVVLDPFVGAGTTVVAAMKAGRRAIGSDKNPAYLGITKERVKDLKLGKLRLRQSGLAVRKPPAGSAVA